MIVSVKNVFITIPSPINNALAGTATAAVATKQDIPTAEATAPTAKGPIPSAATDPKTNQVNFSLNDNLKTCYFN